MKRASSEATQTSPTTLMHHLRELQLRMLASIAALVIGGIITYFFYTEIFTFLKFPLNGPLYYTSPSGSFAFILKICLIGAFALAIPVIIYNLVMFVQPAVGKFISRLRAYLTSFLSLILAVAGAAFGFFVIVPSSLRFFNNFQLEGLESIMTADSYLQLVMNIIITFAIMFQLPLLITFIDFIKPLTPKGLFKAEKWVVLGSLVVALLVPYSFDLTVSLLIAAPIVVLYNIAIVFVLIQHAIRAAAEKKRQIVTVNVIPAPAPTLPSILPRAVEDIMASAVDATPAEQPVQKPAATHRPPMQPGARRTMDFQPAKVPQASVQPPAWATRRYQAPSERVKTVQSTPALQRAQLVQ